MSVDERSAAFDRDRRREQAVLGRTDHASESDRLLDGHDGIIAHAVTDSSRLLEPHELAEFGPAAATLLPLDLVDPNPQNPRQRLVEVEELAASIKEFGLLQPVTVRRVTSTNGDDHIYLLPCKHAVLLPKSSGTPPDLSTAKDRSGEAPNTTSPAGTSTSALDSPKKTTERISAVGFSKHGGSDWSTNTSAPLGSRMGEPVSASGHGKSPVRANLDFSLPPVCPFCGSSAEGPSPQLLTSIGGLVGQEGGKGGAIGKTTSSKQTITSWTEQWPNSWMAAPQTKSRADALSSGYTVVTQNGQVANDETRFELLGGHRRRAAIALLAEAEPYEPKWKTVAAVIRTFDDDTAYLALLAGQLHSKSWAPREEAAALEALAVTRTYKEIGKLIHKSEAWAGKRLRIYSDAVLSGFVQSGRLAPSVAQELLPVKQAAQRRELAERAGAEQWGQVEARAAVRALKASRMISQIGRLSRDLLAALALVRPEQIPDETGKTLLRLRRRITLMGRGPVIPSIEAAQQAAGVNPDKPTRRRRPAGYRAGFKPSKR